VNRDRGPNFAPLIGAHRDSIIKLARIERIEFQSSEPTGSIQVVHGSETYSLLLDGVIDFAAERARLAKEIDKCVKEIEAIDKKMSNPNFVEKAPIEIVEENRERRVAFEERKAKLSAAVAQLSA
jgi:valyl-tRNA synthetase